MNRVTVKQLQAVVDRINRLRAEPMEPWSEGKANIGNYHLSFAYGGVCLHRMVSEGGGVSDVFNCGHVPKRNLLDRMYAFIAGIGD